MAAVNQSCLTARHRALHETLQVTQRRAVGASYLAYITLGLATPLAVQRFQENRVLRFLILREYEALGVSLVWADPEHPTDGHEAPSGYMDVWLNAHPKVLAEMDAKVSAAAVE